MDNIKEQWIYAFQNSNIEEMKRILSIDKSVVNLQNSYGSSAIIYYGTGDYIENVKMLIEAGVDLNVQYGNGITVLMANTLNNRRKIVELLVNSGADMFIEDKFQRTCLHHALLFNEIELVEYFLQQGLTFGTTKHRYDHYSGDYRQIKQTTHDYFEDYEGYKEYRMINEQE